MHGLVATWSVAPGPTQPAADVMENNLLYWFAELYGAAPLGNAQAAWAEAKSPATVAPPSPPLAPPIVPAP